MWHVVKPHSLLNVKNFQFPLCIFPFYQKKKSLKYNARKEKEFLNFKEEKVLAVF